VLIVLPVLVLMRRGPVPPGAATAVVSVVAWLSAAVEDFPVQAVAGAALASGAALFVDAVLVMLDRRRGPNAPGRLMVAGALLPVLVWPARLGVLDRQSR